jgi:hypothetical protein
VGEEEVFTEAGVAADFMEAEEGFTAVEDFPAEATLDSAVDIRLAGIVVADIEAAASTEVAATTVVTASTGVMAVMDGAAGATVGAAEVGDMVEVGAAAGVGAGDLATAGHIMAGDIRMATTATARITRPTLIILTRTQGLRTT